MSGTWISLINAHLVFPNSSAGQVRCENPLGLFCACRYKCKHGFPAPDNAHYHPSHSSHGYDL